MNWQTDRGGRLEIERDHRGERRVLIFAAVAIVAAVGAVIVRLLFLALP